MEKSGTISRFTVRQATARNIPAEWSLKAAKHDIWNLVLEFTLIPWRPLHRFAEVGKCPEHFIGGNRRSTIRFNTGDEKQLQRVRRLKQIVSPSGVKVMCGGAGTIAALSGSVRS